MKRDLLCTCVAFALSLTAGAQGTIDFRNTTAQRVSDAETGQYLDSQFLAQIYWATSTNGPWRAASPSGQTNPAPAVPFRDGVGTGVWNPGTDPTRVVGVPAGSAVWLQVHAWQASGGSTYEQAFEAAGIKIGSSAPFRLASTGGGGSPPSLPSALTGFQSFQVRLTGPRPPTVTFFQSTNIEVFDINSAIVMAPTVVGTAPLQFQWHRNGSPLAGATLASLELQNLNPTHAGFYTLVAANAAGTSTSAPVRIYFRPPSILQQPLSYDLIQGEVVALSVAADGTRPLNYFWLKNGQPIPGATNATLLVSGGLVTDAGSYQVRVENVASNVVSSVAVLRAVPPLIRVPPVSQPFNQGMETVFTVSASGSGLLTYQWKLNSVDIPGATSATYRITSAAVADAGDYTVLVSNPAGSVLSATASLSPEAPRFITEVACAAVARGTAQTLWVDVTGSLPMSLQWFRNGVAISGATNNTLIFNSIQVGDAGQYTVRAVNPIGERESLHGHIEVGDLDDSIPGGTVDFRNNTTIPVFDGNGTNQLNLLSGPQWVSQLYYSKTETGMVAVANPPAPFRTGAGAGVWHPGSDSTRVLPGIVRGEQAFIQIRVWDVAAGATYEQVRCHGGKHGRSIIFGLVTGGGGVPSTLPTALTGLRSFGIEIATNAIVVPPGFSLIANPLFQGENTVIEILPSVPEGTILFRFDNVRKVYSVNLFDFGAWTNPDEKITPGEGAFILNPTDQPFQPVFTGTTEPQKKIPFRSPGFHLVSCTQAQAGHIEQFLNFAPKSGDTVYRFSNGRYLISSYEFGNWQGFQPVIAVGESVFLRLVE